VKPYYYLIQVAFQANVALSPLRSPEILLSLTWLHNTIVNAFIPQM